MQLSGGELGGRKAPSDASAGPAPSTCRSDKAPARFATSRRRRARVPGGAGELRLVGRERVSEFVRSDDRLTRAAITLLVIVLVGLAAWPVLIHPLDTGAPVIRAAAAATDIFGDRFHPFLPFLLFRPTTWWSIEPWALRLVPLIFLALEGVLAVAAARYAGDGVAGVLAGIWFACEVRRRHGLADLSDWDVAGAFLMMLLLVLQRPWARSGAGTVLLPVLMCAGMASSWLMIVPDGVLVGCVGIDVLRRRWRLAPALLLAAIFVGLAIQALRIFVAGSPGAISDSTLWEQMYSELPLARSAAMALPLILAALSPLRPQARLPPRFL